MTEMQFNIGTITNAITGRARHFDVNFLMEGPGSCQILFMSKI